MVRVLWYPLTRPAVSVDRRGLAVVYIPSTGGGRHYKYAAATRRVEPCPGPGRGSRTAADTGDGRVRSAPSWPGDARSQGAGGGGPGGRVCPGGGGRGQPPASQSEARCGWPDTPDSQSEEGGKYIFSCEYISREQVARSHK